MGGERKHCHEEIVVESRGSRATRAWRPAHETLFGSVRGKTLMALALMGPATFTQLGERVGIDKRRFQYGYEWLEPHGLVTADKRAYCHGRHTFLDPRFPVAAELRAFLFALGRMTWPNLKSRAKVLERFEPYREYTPTVDAFETLFFSRSKTRSLLTLAAAGKASAYALADFMPMKHTEVHRIFSELEWSGVLAARREGDRRVFFLDDRAPWAVELKALLEAIVRLRPEHARAAELMETRDRRLRLGPYTKAATERRRIAADREARAAEKRAKRRERGCLRMASVVRNG